jgi:hypothetical protein
METILAMQDSLPGSQDTLIFPSRNHRVPYEYRAVIHGYPRAPALLRDFDHLRHTPRNLTVAALRDVLVPNRHGRGRVPQSGHKLGNGRAALSSHNCAGMPQVVEAEIIAASGLACPLPVLLEGPAAPDLLTIGGREE